MEKFKYLESIVQENRGITEDEAGCNSKRQWEYCDKKVVKSIKSKSKILQNCYEASQ